MTATRIEHDSLGPVTVPADKLWGAQTQRSLEHFSIGDDLIPREMVPAYAIVKKAAALVNHKAGRLGDTQKDLIVRVCDEILEGQHQDQFPGDQVVADAEMFQGPLRLCPPELVGRDVDRSETVMFDASG